MDIAPEDVATIKALLDKYRALRVYIDLSGVIYPSLVTLVQPPMPTPAAAAQELARRAEKPRPIGELALGRGAMSAEDMKEYLDAGGIVPVKTPEGKIIQYSRPRVD